MAALLFQFLPSHAKPLWPLTVATAVCIPVQDLIWQRKKKYETISTNNNRAEFKHCCICSVVNILQGLVTQFLKNASLPMMFSRALYTSKRWNSKTSSVKPLHDLIIFYFRKQIIYKST